MRFLKMESKILQCFIMLFTLISLNSFASGKQKYSVEDTSKNTPIEPTKYSRRSSTSSTSNIGGQSSIRRSSTSSTSSTSNIGGQSSSKKTTPNSIGSQSSIRRSSTNSTSSTSNIGGQSSSRRSSTITSYNIPSYISSSRNPDTKKRTTYQAVKGKFTPGIYKVRQDLKRMHKITE